MSYDNMMSFLRVTEALAEVAGRTGWDQETMMPPGAAPQRAEEAAALKTVLHDRSTDPRLGAWLEEITPKTPVQAANLRILRHEYMRSCRLPADLVAEIARTTSLAHRAWAEARAAENLSVFLPHLTRVVALRREQGAALAEGGDPYDALLDGYEPGMSSARLSEIFDGMRPGIVDLRARVLDRPAPKALEGHFDPHAQRLLAEKIALVFGYDLERGRIDTALHPFSSGSGLDVRITTRVDPADPLNCLYSTIHEVGHACYEQGIDRDYLLTPLGHGASMGVHESQSRLYENQLGRSAGFAEALLPMMRDAFGDFGIDDPQTLYAAVNRVEEGFIRTEADELSYNLHVFLRFDLEQALIRGDLQVADLEAAWNDRFAADFGRDVPKPSLGVLQDVHWSEGLIGYFPTYSLGNIYAGSLFAALRRARPGLDAELAAGDLSGATEWLRSHVQRHGALFTPDVLIAEAAGEEVSSQPLLAYLEEKFGGLYGV